MARPGQAAAGFEWFGPGKMLGLGKGDPIGPPTTGGSEGSHRHSLTVKEAETNSYIYVYLYDFLSSS
jgi:hypothetical protein